MGQSPTARTVLFPQVAHYGGIVRIPNAAEPARRGTKIIFDITADSKPEELNKGLESVARYRAHIRREAKKTDHGVETLTESVRPEVAAAIQKHVASMEQRVKAKKPLHLRDPLFAEVFRHADQIKFACEKTEKGVRVIETSDDPYVVKLIQSHAEVVSLFVKNGFVEVHRNHELPQKP